MAPRPYNILGLCAGVGGLELGVRIARPGARGVCYVEREVPAAARLVARMQDGSLHHAPIWSDLTTFDGLQWRGLVDCLTSGDPCQPNSVAGKQLGRDDDRWILDHVFRIIDEVRPARVFRENVPGNADGQLAAIVPALEGMGYRVAAGIFSARGAGASHLRERLFIMADRDGSRCTEAGTGSEIDTGRKPLSPCGDLANADGGNPSPKRQQLRGEQRLLAEGHGDRRDVADAPSPRRSPRRPEESRALRHEAWRSQSDGRRDGLADTVRPGLPVGSLDADGRGSLRGEGQAAASGSADLDDAVGRGRWGEGDAGQQADWRDGPGPSLLFAPGPSDPVWSQIIRSAPHLAPAVSDFDQAQSLILREIEDMGWTGDEAQTQSLLRRLDARLAQRVDRLRAGGNGVSSLAAALAWRTLEASLAAGAAESVRLKTLTERQAA